MSRFARHDNAERRTFRQLDSALVAPDTYPIVTAAVSTHDARRNAKVTSKAALLLSGVLTLVFVISFLFSEQGISDLQRSRRRVQDLRADIARLNSENEQLSREIESLKRSTFAVERIAREDLNMSKPGETVYMLPAR